MNRFIRLAKLDRLIKEGAKKSDDLAALRSIFMQKYPGDRSAAGLAQQYYDRFIGKSDLNAPVLTPDTLPQPLPDTTEELKDLLRSVEVEKKKSKVEELSESILKSYPNVDLKGFSEDHLAWIHKRYIEGKSEKDEVIHSIEDSLPTLRRFTSVQNKWRSTPEFKTKLSNAGFGDISLIGRLSIDEMEKIISLDDSDLTVQVEGVEIKAGEYLGKFGEWNLWLPHTKETSVKIAGYDPVTYEPDTTWCTARTRGSNLFYNYIGREDHPSFLFYIIKDNPQADDDWLSLGYISGGNKLVPDFSGRHGGLSVNRDNKGLTEKDYQRILGDLWGQIKSRIEGEIEKFKTNYGEYVSPARSIVLKLAKDVVEFRKEFAPKSNSEKEDFAKVISDSDPSEEVVREILLWKCKAKTSEYIKYDFIYAEEKGYYDLNLTALKKISEDKEAESIFSDRELRPYISADGRYKKVIEEYIIAEARKDGARFISSSIPFIKDLGYDISLAKGSAVAKAIDIIVETQPDKFYYLATSLYGRSPFLMSVLSNPEFSKKIFTSYIKNNPNQFLGNISLSRGNLPGYIVERGSSNPDGTAKLAYSGVVVDINAAIRTSLEAYASNPKLAAELLIDTSDDRTVGFSHVFKTISENLNLSDEEKKEYIGRIIDVSSTGPKNKYFTKKILLDIERASNIFSMAGRDVSVFINSSLKEYLEDEITNQDTFNSYFDIFEHLFDSADNLKPEIDPNLAKQFTFNYFKYYINGAGVPEAFFAHDSTEAKRAKAVGIYDEIISMAKSKYIEKVNDKAKDDPCSVVDGSYINFEQLFQTQPDLKDQLKETFITALNACMPLKTYSYVHEGGGWDLAKLLGLDDVNKKSLEILSDEIHYNHYIEAYADFIQKCIELNAENLIVNNIAKDEENISNILEPASYGARFFEVLNEYGRDNLLGDALEQLFKKFPNNFLYPRNNLFPAILSFGKTDLAKNGLEYIYSNRIYHMYDIKVAKELGLDALNEEFIKTFVPMALENKSLKNLNSLLDVIKQYPEVYLKYKIYEHPDVKNFLEKRGLTLLVPGQDLPVQQTEMNLEEGEDYDSINKESYIKSRLIKLSNSLESLGMNKEASSIKYLINIR